MAIWAILRPFGVFYGHLAHFVVILVYFFPFWYVEPRKIWHLEPLWLSGKVVIMSK
jgi:hypothetical protein